eukprot:9339650-Alexandrium_andersonii.AAC.1
MLGHGARLLPPGLHRPPHECHGADAVPTRSPAAAARAARRKCQRADRHVCRSGTGRAGEGRVGHRGAGARSP